MFAHRQLRTRLATASSSSGNNNTRQDAFAPKSKLERVFHLGSGGGKAAFMTSTKCSLCWSGIALIITVLFTLHTSIVRVQSPLSVVKEQLDFNNNNNNNQKWTGLSSIGSIIQNGTQHQNSTNQTQLLRPLIVVDVDLRKENETITTATTRTATKAPGNTTENKTLSSTIALATAAISMSELPPIVSNNKHIANNQTDQIDLLQRPGNMSNKDEAVPPFVNHSFRFDRNLAEAALLKWGADALRPVISAYLETSTHPRLRQSHHLLSQLASHTQQQHDLVLELGVVNDTIPEAEYEQRLPLPVRTGSPQDLLHFYYPKLKTCHDHPAKLPIDRGVQHDQNGNVIQWNLLRTLNTLNNITSENDTRSILDDPRDCPVDVDPFLPWIHDIFPSLDGSKIHILTQNKRQCKLNGPLLSHMTPQVALAQHVSVQRINYEQAKILAPMSWHGNNNGNNDTEPATAAAQEQQLDHASALPRYRLVPHEFASPDGVDTRYICRFYGLDVATSPPRWVVVGETLSTFPYSYEYAFFREGSGFLSTSDHPDCSNYHLSHFQFTCPVPSSSTALANADDNNKANSDLRTLLASGDTILSDGTPTLALSIIPIRTPARYNEHYLSSDYIGPHQPPEGGLYFNASKHWGFHHVLPQVEASGRWEFLPLCYPPQKKSRPSVVAKNKTQAVSSLSSSSSSSSSSSIGNNGTTKKPYTLTACVWASAIYQSPNGGYLLTDNIDRLAEWVEFHLMVGFEHIFIYDNSKAQGVNKQNTTTTTTIAAEDDEEEENNPTSRRSFKHVVDMFPPTQVTLIEWRATICNNDNVPAEWSSQYAAENSCIARHGPFTEWMASLDIDEYLVPMGNFTDMKSLVRHVSETEDTKVIMFPSVGARLRFDSSYDVGHSRQKLSNASFLGAYNCGVDAPWEWGSIRRKEIYRTDYVYHHWVHYSTYTRMRTETYKEALQNGLTNITTHRRQPWKLINWRYEDPLQRVVNVSSEGVMVHTKTTKLYDTEYYKDMCHVNRTMIRECLVGFPWPNKSIAGQFRWGDAGSFNDLGMTYNCLANDKISNHWLPRLFEAMAKRKKSLEGAKRTAA